MGADTELLDRKASPTWISTSFITTGLYSSAYTRILLDFNWTNVFVVNDLGSVPIRKAIGDDFVKEFIRQPGTTCSVAPARSAAC